MTRTQAHAFVLTFFAKIAVFVGLLDAAQELHCLPLALAAIAYGATAVIETLTAGEVGSKNTSK